MSAPADPREPGGKEIMGIPNEMKKLPQWICYRRVPGSSSMGQFFNPNHDPELPFSSEIASTDNPSTWGTYKEADTALDSNGYDGLAFVLTSRDPYVCIKFEGYLHGDTLDPIGESLVAAFPSYTEVTPSGCGVQIICKVKGDLPSHFTNTVEMMGKGVALQVTEQPFPLNSNPREIFDCTPEVEQLRRAFQPTTTTSDTEDLEHPKRTWVLPTSDDPTPANSRDYLSNKWEKDALHYRSSGTIKTGFDSLDKAIGSLAPGLYALGGLSSLGKTTFTHQLSENIAAQGVHVLYFALEQSSFELHSKGIIRELTRYGLESRSFTKLSAYELRRGQLNSGTEIVEDDKESISKCLKQYSEKYKTLSVVEGGFDTDIDMTCEYIKTYVEVNQVTPAVVIDYLQVIQPMPDKQGRLPTGRDALDQIVRKLKRVQEDLDCILFMISSLNRTNYLSRISFESFKESGMIEYTCDEIWGLQLGVLTYADVFQSKENVNKKREQIDYAKEANPRDVELILLKTRNHRFRAGGYHFNYYPKYELFEEPGLEKSELMKEFLGDEYKHLVLVDPKNKNNQTEETNDLPW